MLSSFFNVSSRETGVLFMYIVTGLFFFFGFFLFCFFLVFFSFWFHFVNSSRPPLVYLFMTVSCSQRRSSCLLFSTSMSTD